jgi:hypothetical protein
VAEAGQSVNYVNGQVSSDFFHKRPDGAACIPTEDGGWIYVSNSEHNRGGVGAIKFDSQGRVVNYKRILNGTSTNCSGKLVNASSPLVMDIFHIDRHEFIS